MITITETTRTARPPLPYHLPNVDAVLARLPVAALRQIVEVLAGQRDRGDYILNAAACMNAVMEYCDVCEQIAIYEWSQAQQEVLAYMRDGHDTPYTQCLWDRAIGMASTAQAADAVRLVAKGLCNQPEEAGQ